MRRAITMLKIALGFSVLLVVAGVGCEPAAVELSEESTEVRLSVLPDASEERLRRHYEPLIDYLEASTGYEISLGIPNDYDHFLREFDAGRIDMAWFGGLTFARAHARSGAKALVTRDIDVSFTSSFVYRRSEAMGSAEPSLEDFKGRTFAFGPRLSTSGHLMPRAFLEQRGIETEQYFAGVRHSNAHDETVQWVRDGVVAIAAVNTAIYRSMLREDAGLGEIVVLVERTTPYQNYVWATRDGLPEKTRLALRNAFLALDPNDANHIAILQGLGAGGFLPLDASEYDQLVVLASEQGLLGKKP